MVPSFGFLDFRTSYGEPPLEGGGGGVITHCKTSIRGWPREDPLRLVLSTKTLWIQAAIPSSIECTAPLICTLALCSTLLEGRGGGSKHSLLDFRMFPCFALLYCGCARLIFACGCPNVCLFVQTFV